VLSAGSDLRGGALDGDPDEVDTIPVLLRACLDNPAVTVATVYGGSLGLAASPAPPSERVSRPRRRTSSAPRQPTASASRGAKGSPSRCG
jgi:hypothetical protein